VDVDVGGLRKGALAMAFEDIQSSPGDEIGFGI